MSHPGLDFLVPRDGSLNWFMKYIICGYPRLTNSDHQKAQEKTQLDPSFSAPKCNFAVQHFVRLFVFCVCVFLCIRLCFLCSSVGEMLPVFLPYRFGFRISLFFLCFDLCFLCGLKQKAPLNKARKKHEKKT